MVSDCSSLFGRSWLTRILAKGTVSIGSGCLLGPLPKTTKRRLKGKLVRNMEVSKRSRSMRGCVWHFAGCGRFKLVLALNVPLYTVSSVSINLCQLDHRESRSSRENRSFNHVIASRSRFAQIRAACFRTVLYSGRPILCLTLLCLSLSVSQGFCRESHNKFYLYKRHEPFTGRVLRLVVRRLS